MPGMSLSDVELLAGMAEWQETHVSSWCASWLKTELGIHRTGMFDGCTFGRPVGGKSTW